MRVRSVLAVGAVLALLLSGCSRGQEANGTLPTASSSAAPEPTLEPLGPADFPVPDEAREETPDGATAALTYYLNLVVHQAGSDGSPLRDLSSDCTFCLSIADQYDSDALANYTLNGGQITIGDIAAPAINEMTAEFSFSLSQAPTAVLDAAGEPVPGRGSDGFPLTSAGASMTWSEARGIWVMNQIVLNG